MKWVDYREKLGVGFNNAEKFKMLRNIITVFLKLLREKIPAPSYKDDTFTEYFIMIGEHPRYRNMSGVLGSIDDTKSMKDLVSKYIAFSNTSQYHFRSNTTIEKIRNFLPEQLKKLNIQYDIVEDEDGCFIFPRGAKELDDALISEPLEWLSDYPKARKTYIDALKQYSDGIFIRDTADNLRKALETFLQEFLKNNKNLETNKNEICKYLGQKCVDGDIAGLFQPLINSYKSINDKMAKHNDKIDKKMLEFFIYQTGVLIRMVLVVKQSEQEGATDAD